MSKVIKLGITKNSAQKIEEVEKIEILSGKGVVGDRSFQDSNDARKQITLIESENIDYYNKEKNTNIPYLDFRRNIITEGIKLNELVGKELIIGEVRVRAHDLCRPCKYLEESLKQKNIVKEFLRKGGLRCEILTDGKIFIGDIIK